MSFATAACSGIHRISQSAILVTNQLKHTAPELVFTCLALEGETESVVSTGSGRRVWTQHQTTL